MTTYVVTTATDTLDGDDGLLSLREAVALANDDADADVITFDLSNDFSINQVSIRDSAIEIAANTTLTIDGDLNDDGITDIVLTAGLNHHLTVAVGAQVTLTGLDLISGGDTPSNVGVAPAGAPGANGGRGFGKEDIVSDPDLHIFDFFGVSGEGGAPGENGVRGTDGHDRDVEAGAIVNFGILDLVRVGFAGNDPVGGVGGNAGKGGTGGAGGQGGEGVQGDRLSNAGNPDAAPYRVNPGDGGDISAGNGGNGANGANGGDGGDGGDGGSAAGAIYNATGATLAMTDVAFGGILTSLWDRGEGNSGNTAKGGRGGYPGDGGNGGGGAWGGDGGDTGYSHRVTVVGEEAHHTMTFGGAGKGGNGGDGGRGGNAGAYGRSGDAAGAILNDGAITGTAALYDNSASTTDMTDFFQPGPVSGLGGLAGTGGTGGAGASSALGSSTPDGADGTDGEEGGDGFGRIFGETGDTSDGILNRGGSTDSVTTGSALVYAHGIDLEVNEGGEVSFNVIRIGATGGDITVTWEVRTTGANGVSAADFYGGELPSGEVLLSAPVAFGDAAKTVSFQVATDALGEALEDFQIVLTGISISSGDVTPGTSTLNGKIVDGEAVEPPPDTGNTAPSITSNGGGSQGNVAVAENTTVVTKVVANDDVGDILTYKILAGGDGALFKLHPTTHALSFKSAPDFEAPKDANKDNIYDVTVQVSDGAKADTQTLHVSVTDIGGVTIVGSKKNDKIDASHTPKGQPLPTNEEDTIAGGKKNDTIFGLGGDDTLSGGTSWFKKGKAKGANKLTGGDGADGFLFDTKLKKSKTKVMDFDSAEGDTVLLASSIFKHKKLKDGDISAKDFKKLFDYTKGVLKYDGDEVAKFAGKPDLDADDLLLV